MESKTTNTTVTIDSSTAKKLDRLAKASEVSKKDFIAISMDYFLKNGIDPVTCETPTQELVKLNKRIDDLFRFLKHQETATIVPMASGSLKNHAVTHDKIGQMEKTVKGNQAVIFEQVKSARDEVKDLKKELTKRDEEIKTKDDQFRTLLEAYKGLLAYIDPKDKSKLSQVFNKISNL